jgi:hypothetical protein
MLEKGMHKQNKHKLFIEYLVVATLAGRRHDTQHNGILHYSTSEMMFFMALRHSE